MNWDWDKLQQRKGRPPSGGEGGGGAPQGPSFDDFARKLKGMKLPGGAKLIILLVVGIWLASGIFIVNPEEEAVVTRFGAYSRTVGPGPHYHFPWPVEWRRVVDVQTVRQIDVGFRSVQENSRLSSAQQSRHLPEEALMLTEDENIVDVQFSVQYRIMDLRDYLFKNDEQEETVKSAAEAAMRGIIGDNPIDAALTDEKEKIQNETQEVMQEILDRYNFGDGERWVLITRVQLQDVHPPKQVLDAFKDVASAREDKDRIIKEAEAYSRDILPKARGQARAMINEAEAYRQSVSLKAAGDASRFLSVLKEYNKAQDVTKMRLFLDAMESIYSSPGLEKVILMDDALSKVLPLLPLDSLTDPGAGKGGQ